MRSITAEEARKLVKESKMEKGLKAYCYLMQTVRNTNVFEDSAFRKKYDGFYSVRRNRAFLDKYFAIMEEMKAADSIDFETIFGRIKTINDSCEISFASKMVHTLDPAYPIWDSIVTKNHFGISAPFYGMSNRGEICVERYKLYHKVFAEYMTTQEARNLIEIFDEAFPRSGITDNKKVDFILWRHRARKS